MALKSQPYLPLYVQDFMTDEKLAECSAESTGVYIRLMCLLHKSDEYGCILLKQKDKQTDNQIKNFCLKLCRHILYSNEVLERSLTELLEEGVIQIDGDRLYQKRMVKDAMISEKRAISGATGGARAQSKKPTVPIPKASGEASGEANPKANAEYEYEYENESGNELGTEVPAPVDKRRFRKPNVEQVDAYCLERGNAIDAQYFVDFYESKGWKVGDQAMKDWKAAVRTWEKRGENATNSPQGKPKSQALYENYID